MSDLLREIQTESGKDWDEWLAGVTAAFEGAEGDAGMDARVDWYMELLGELDAATERDEAVARARMEHIQSWLDSENDRRDRRAEWLVEQIRGLSEGYEFPEGKKSRRLPHGTFGLRAKKPTVEILDKDLATSWATEHVPEALKSRESQSLTKTEIIEYVTKTGVHLDPSVTGLRFVDARDDFYVTPNTKE